MRGSFDSDLARLETRRAVIVDEIEKLVEFARRALPRKRCGNLYLTARRHKPACPSCPHGPYWYSAWMGPDRRWRGTYLGLRLSKGWVRQFDQRENFRVLEALDRRASELREDKKAVLATLRRIKLILAKTEGSRRD